MPALKVYQDVLEETFPSLTVFSDLKWDQVMKEYLASHEERPELENFALGFPQFLQQKAQDGDSPLYLFELAFYELTQNHLANTEYDFPKTPGIHLNPSASFLNLEFDVQTMLEESTKGSVEIIERPHVLCLYKHPIEGLSQVELDEMAVSVLSSIEVGSHKTMLESEDVKRSFKWLIHIGLVFNIT